MNAHVEPRSRRLLLLLQFIVRGWPVPERLRRSVGWHMRIVPLGKLQRHIRQGQGVLWIVVFDLPT